MGGRGLKGGLGREASPVQWTEATSDSGRCGHRPEQLQGSLTSRHRRSCYRTRGEDNPGRGITLAAGLQVGRDAWIISP